MLTRQRSLDFTNVPAQDGSRRFSGSCPSTTLSRRSSLDSISSGGRQTSLEVPRGEDDSGEEVTETKIIGVEKGVIRRRSFKRRLTKEEISKRGYGNDKAEYERIVERVMGEKFIVSAVEGLMERWKMLGFMHDDCMDMVDKWDKTRLRKIQDRRSQDKDVLIAIVSLVFVLVACTLWILSKIFF